MTLEILKQKAERGIVLWNCSTTLLNGFLKKMKFQKLKLVA